MTCPKVTLSTAYPTWTGLGLNLGLSNKRLQSKQLSDSMAVHLSGTDKMDIKNNVVGHYFNVLPVITLRSLI